MTKPKSPRPSSAAAVAPAAEVVASAHPVVAPAATAAASTSFTAVRLLMGIQGGALLLAGPGVTFGAIGAQTLGLAFVGIVLIGVGGVLITLGVTLAAPVPSGRTAALVAEWIAIVSLLFAIVAPAESVDLASTCADSAASTCIAVANPSMSPIFSLTGLVMAAAVIAAFQYVPGVRQAFAVGPQRRKTDRTAS